MLAAVLSAVPAGCGDSGPACGPGTVRRGDVCVPGDAGPLDAGGTFHRERGAGTVDAVLAGVGGALIVSGVLMFVLRPIGVGVSADATGARLDWSGRF